MEPTIQKNNFVQVPFIIFLIADALYIIGLMTSGWYLFLGPLWFFIYGPFPLAFAAVGLIRAIKQDDRKHIYQDINLVFSVSYFIYKEFTTFRCCHIRGNGNTRPIF